MRTLAGYNEIVKAMSLTLRAFTETEHMKCSGLYTDVYYLTRYSKMMDIYAGRDETRFMQHCAAFDAHIRILVNRGYVNGGGLLCGE